MVMLITIFIVRFNYEMLYGRDTTTMVEDTHLYIHICVYASLTFHYDGTRIHAYIHILGVPYSKIV